MDNNSMLKAVLITGKPKKKKESTPINELNQKLLVNTSDLMRLLSLGRPSAVQMGEEAGAKVLCGRKVMWNVSKVLQYIDSLTAPSHPITGNAAGRK